MELILTSNILENKNFAQFIDDTFTQKPQAHILITGDLLNVFPEPGEDLRGSIFYEIYGDMITREMENLVTDRFKNVAQSSFIGPLKEMFMPTGKNFKRTQDIMSERYTRLFNEWSKILDRHPQNKIFFIPGNMDEPQLAQRLLSPSGQIVQWDTQVNTLDGVRMAGVGGIPNSGHPFRGIVEISPYEMPSEEYQRRLQLMWGADVLITHLSPQEYPPLMEFVMKSPLRVLICRAPFNFARPGNFRGDLQEAQYQGKKVLLIRPFDYPNNESFHLKINSEAADVAIYAWH